MFYVLLNKAFQYSFFTISNLYFLQFLDVVYLNKCYIFDRFWFVFCRLIYRMIRLLMFNVIQTIVSNNDKLTLNWIVEIGLWIL